MSAGQLRILREIRDGGTVSEDDGNWAVQNGYAAHGEDGDIDLTVHGRKLLEGGAD